MIFLYIPIAILFAFIGARMARVRDRDPAVWGLICALLPLIGVLALAVAGKSGNSPKSYSGNVELAQKWIILKDVDPDIRAAAARMQANGSRHEHALSEKYLALNDKSYLAAAEEAVVRQFDAEETAFEAKETIVGVVQGQSSGQSNNGSEFFQQHKVAMKVFAFALMASILEQIFFALTFMSTFGLVSILSTATFCAYVGYRSEIKAAAMHVALGGLLYAIVSPVVSGLLMTSLFYWGITVGDIIRGIGFGLLEVAFYVGVEVCAAWLATKRNVKGH